MCGGIYLDNNITTKYRQDCDYMAASEICLDFDGMPYEVIRNSLFSKIND